jgi:hypothetical protein
MQVADCGASKPFSSAVPCPRLQWREKTEIILRAMASSHNERVLIQYGMLAQAIIEGRALCHPGCSSTRRLTRCPEDT